MTQGGVSIREARRALAASRQRLLRRPGVRHVTLGRRWSAGRPTRLMAVRVWVGSKRDPGPGRRLPRRVRIPTPRPEGRGGWVPVDVEAEDGPLRLLALRGGDALEGWTVGAAGLAYRTPAARDAVLTCAHVVAGPDDPGFGEVVLGPTPSGAEGPIGVVWRSPGLRSGEVHRFDVALVSPHVPIDPLWVGDPPEPVVGLGRIRVGSPAPLVYHGRQGEVVAAFPESVATPITVRRGALDLRFAGCVQLRVLRGRPSAGDSGSLLLRRTAAGALACGVVFAGSSRRILGNRLIPALGALSSEAASKDGSPEDVSVEFGDRASAVD